MRVIIAGLLVVGGGLAALALIWLFYTTSEPQSSLTTSVITDVQTVISADGTSADETGTVQPSSAPAVTRSKQTNVAELNPVSDGTPFLKIDIVRIGPDGSAVFAGRGSSDADVMIFEKDMVLAQTSVSADGEWVAVAEQLLSPGEHLIIAEMTTTDGEVLRADQAVIIELAISGQDTPLVALVPMTERADVELIQTPKSLTNIIKTARQLSETEDLGPELKAVLVEPNDLSVLTLSWADQDNLFIKGRSSGGTAVRGMLNDRVLNAYYDADSGDWTATVRLDGMTGREGRLVIQLLTTDDEIIASRQLDLNLGQLDIGRDGSEMVIIEKGDMLWRIAYRTYGDGIRYLDIVNRNQDRIADPDLIYPAQIFALPE